MSEPPITNHEPRDSSRDRPTTNHEAGATNHVENDDEISVFDLLIVLAKHKKLIFGLPFAVAVLAAIYSLTLPAIYTADTKLLPPAQSQSAASSLAAQLGGLAGLAGVGVRNSNDFYIAMLKSRTVADNLVQRFGPMKNLKFKSPSQGYQWLEGNPGIASGKPGLITIEGDEEDPSSPPNSRMPTLVSSSNFPRCLR